MVSISASLLKKRSEHHDGLLIDLEEISLHQQGIDKIEYIGSVCKNLRILLLQNNLIGKIENINKLKDLEYLNLALNNITRIEGLAGCESLKKLDLTVNYIHFDTFQDSLESLQGNFNLEDLYLAGNPVALNWDKTKYRLFVIGHLPQLKQLDGDLVCVSERMKAEESLVALRSEVDLLKLQQIPSHFSPDSRKASYYEINSSCCEPEPVVFSRSEPTPALNSKGEVRQCDEGGYNYHLSETITPSGEVHLVFELETPRYMDTSLIEVDLNPSFVRCIIKGRVTQIKFDEEVIVFSSTVCRSKTTGWLKISAPIMGRRARPPASVDDQKFSAEIPPLEPF